MNGKRRSVLSTVGLSAALLIYSNVDAWIELRTRRAAPDRVNFSHLAMLGLVLAWGWADRLTARDLGVNIGGLGRSLGWGSRPGWVGPCW